MDVGATSVSAGRIPEKSELQTTMMAATSARNGTAVHAVPGLQLDLLGGFRARTGAGGALALATRKTQALLAFLAVAPGQTHPRNKLATLFWSDMRQKQSRGNLRQALVRLRRSLGEILRLEGEDVGLDSARVASDVQRFERCAAAGTPEALTEASRLYQGDFLAGLSVQEPPFEEWLLAERERLHESAVAVVARLLAHHRQAGHLEDALQSALQLLTLDPLQEPVHRTLMRLYVQLGRRGAALRQYQACAALLERELRAWPEPETKALYQHILGTRPASPVTEELSEPAGAPDSPPNPLSSEPRGHEPPLVGREPELARLKGVLDYTWSRQGLVVAITGETGVGKSRLAGELLAEARARGGLTMVGRCYETEKILPFGPWVNALRGLPPDQLGAALEGLRPAWRVEVGRLLPEVGAEPPGPDASPGALQLFEAVVHLLEQLAARHPVVALLEDLHWADEMSIRLLAFLGRRVSKAAVLAVVTVRDEDAAEVSLLRQTFEELTGDRQAIEVPLRGLSRADTTALVRHLARSEAGSPVAEQIWRASEGNPFMIVETLRAVDAGAALTETSDLPLPERIRDVVGRRLERLGERSQRLVATAAAIGRQFDFALLQRAAAVTEAEASEVVEELVRHRILHGAGEQLEFTHDRVREVALGRLLPAVRKGLHRRIAEALDGVPARDPATHALAVGTHFLSAEAWEQAALFFQRAGDATFAQTGRREAVRYYEQAQAALGQLPTDRHLQERACDLRFNMARILYATGDFTRSHERFREAEALAQALGDDRRQAQILGGLAYLLGSEGEHAGAIEAGDRALGIAQAIGDTAIQAWASVALGRQHFALGGYRLGAERLAEAVRTLRAKTFDRRFGPGTLRLPVGARTWLALCLGQLGRFSQAIACGEEAVRIADALEAAQERVWASYCLGQVLLLRGDAAQGLPLLERAVALSTEGRFPIYVPRTLASLGAAYAGEGRIDEALSAIERAAAATSAIKLRYGHAMVLAMLAQAYLATGRPDQARAFAEQSLAVARARHERGDVAWALHLIGSSVAARTPFEAAAAEDAIGEALALAGELEMRPLEARTRLSLGRLHLAAGRRQSARAELTRAIAELRAMGMTPGLADAEALLTRLGPA